MKNLAFVLLVIAAATIGLNNTGCSEVVEPTTPTDTTDTTETGLVLDNRFTLGFDTYTIDEDENTTSGVYNIAADRTYIFAAGNDPKNGDADFNIEFPGDSVGTFTVKDDGIVFECGTGTKGTVKREEFSADNTNLTVIVTEYGAVGEKIKGTFSGKVMKGINSLDIKNGSFEVERSPDE